MNKTFIKVTIGFLCGAAIGAVSTFFALKNDEENRINKEIDNVRDELIKHYKKPYKNDSTSDDKDITDGAKTDKKGVYEPNNGISEATNTISEKSQANSIKTANNYTKYFETKDENGSVDERDSDYNPFTKADLIDDIAETTPPGSDEESEARWITDDELESLVTDELVCLTFYEGDQVLADDESCETEDPFEVFGHGDMFKKFVMGNTDEVFVKNNRTGTCYDISKDTGRYDEMMEAYHGGM